MTPHRTIRPGSAKHVLLSGASLSEPRALADLRSQRSGLGNVSAYASQLRDWGFLADAGWESIRPGGTSLRRLYLLTELGAAALAAAGPLAAEGDSSGVETDKVAGQGSPADRASWDAASEVLEQCRAAGHPVASAFEAVLAGYITDLEWCAVLDRHRERYGLNT